MSFADFTPNPANASTGGKYEPVPAGTYTLIIEKATLGQSKSGDEMLKFTLAITDGEYEGRKFFVNLMMTHANPEVVALGKSQLDALIVLGKVSFNNTTDCFEGEALTTKVIVAKNKTTGELENKVILALGKEGEIPQAVSAPAKPSTRPTVAPKPAW